MTSTLLFDLWWPPVQSFSVLQSCLSCDWMLDGHMFSRQSYLTCLLSTHVWCEVCRVAQVKWVVKWVENLLESRWCKPNAITRLGSHVTNPGMWNAKRKDQCQACGMCFMTGWFTLFWQSELDLRLSSGWHPFEHHCCDIQKGRHCFSTIASTTNLDRGSARDMVIWANASSRLSQMNVKQVFSRGLLGATFNASDNRWFGHTWRIWMVRICGVFVNLLRWGLWCCRFWWGLWRGGFWRRHVETSWGTRTTRVVTTRMSTVAAHGNYEASYLLPLLIANIAKWIVASQPSEHA